MTRDDWDGFLKHPCWLQLQAWIKDDCTTQLTSYLAQAADERDDLLALQKIRQVLAAKRMGERIIAYPMEQRARLERAATARQTSVTSVAALADPLGPNFRSI